MTFLAFHSLQQATLGRGCPSALPTWPLAALADPSNLENAVASSAAAALPPLALAQPTWGTAGAWQHVQPAPPDAFWPRGTLDGGACATAGSFFVAGKDNATGQQTLYGLDTSTFNWTRYADMPVDTMSPSLLCFGPFVGVLGGSNASGSAVPSLMPISAGATGAWVQLPVAKAIGAHYGHRFVEFGGLVYMFGGLDTKGVPPVPTKWTNTVWALDLARALLLPVAPTRRPAGSSSFPHPRRAARRACPTTWAQGRGASSGGGRKADWRCVIDC